jgi:glycosyltransferase involved in cell wall biosynthesis
VIPVYNRKACVAEALRSVLEQTFSDFEVLVADDGSSDESAQVVAEYAALDSRIRLLRVQHSGAASARNAAIEVAGEHDYVAFLDSDDVWLPTHLASAVQVLEKHSEIGVYFCKAEVPREQCQPHEQREPRATAAHLAKESLAEGLYLLKAETCRRAFIMSQFVPMTPTVVVRREAVVKAPWFNPELMIMEDSEFFLSLAAAGQSFVFNDRENVRVRRFGDNLSDLPGPRRRDAQWWLRSVLLFHEAKLPLCRSRAERAFVASEIASYQASLIPH